MWYWCPVCSRCYQSYERRTGAHDMPLCAYLDCGAPAAVAIPWNRVQPFHTEYPPTPERNVFYPVPELAIEDGD
jgi:hypothetical protein